jgi:hypothetical protein
MMGMQLFAAGMPSEIHLHPRFFLTQISKAIFGDD